MLRENIVVDGVQSVLAGEAQCEYVEVSQQSRVDGEAACSRVHAWQILRVVDLLERQFGAVVPVSVVEMLSDEWVRLHGEVRVHLSSQHRHSIHGRYKTRTKLQLSTEHQELSTSARSIGYTAVSVVNSLTVTRLDNCNGFFAGSKQQAPHWQLATRGWWR